MEAISDLMPWGGLILGYGLLTHGVVLLNDGLYWDGWLVEVWQQNKDRQSMRRFYWEVGMPNLYFEHLVLGSLSRRRAVYGLISLVALLTTSIFVFLTAVHAGLFNPPQAAVVALLLLSYPAYAVAFDGVVSLQYTFKIALFYVGCFFAVTTMNEPGVANALAFVGALILFFVSFLTNAALVFFFGFLLLYGWLVYVGSPGEIAAYEYAKIAAMALLPFAFWFIKQTRFPRHGYYADYNRIRIEPYSVLQVGLRALRHGIDVPMLKPILEFVSSKQASLLLLGLFLGLLALDPIGDSLTVPALDALKILAAGYALWFLGAAPFMAVGQGSSEGGWASKNFMLFHLPYALIVFGWLQLLLGAFSVALIPVILFANMLYIVKIQLLYIAASVKDKALMRWLAANPQLGEASVIKVRDTHWIEYPLERKSTMYWPAYLSCMVKLIWPERRILGVLDNWVASDGRPLTGDEIEEALEKTTIRYMFAPQVQAGPQYLVTIAAPGARFTAPKFDRAFDERGDVHPLKQPAMVLLALEYLYLKWFSPGRLGNCFARHFSIRAARL